MKINISTAKNVTPMIYAYTTPGVIYHDGWTKIGYTERDVQTRIKEQTDTADIRWNLEWQGNAVYDDGTFDTCASSALSSSKAGSGSKSRARSLCNIFINLGLIAAC